GLEAERTDVGLGTVLLVDAEEESVAHAVQRAVRRGGEILDVARSRPDQLGNGSLRLRMQAIQALGSGGRTTVDVPEPVTAVAERGRAGLHVGRRVRMRRQVVLHDAGADE